MGLRLNRHGQQQSTSYNVAWSGQEGNRSWSVPASHSSLTPPQLCWTKTPIVLSQHIWGTPNLGKTHPACSGSPYSAPPLPLSPCSALLLAYQKARHKQESQVGQLETQVGLMTRRQAKQRQALAQALQQLQDRVSAGAPTGPPQPPAMDESILDPPGNLEVPSFLWSRK